MGAVDEDVEAAFVLWLDSDPDEPPDGEGAVSFPELVAFFCSPCPLAGFEAMSDDSGAFSLSE